MSLLDRRGGHRSCECHDLQPEGNKNTGVCMYVCVCKNTCKIPYKVYHAYIHMYIFVVCNDAVKE